MPCRRPPSRNARRGARADWNFDLNLQAAADDADAAAAAAIEEATSTSATTTTTTAAAASAAADATTSHADEKTAAAVGGDNADLSATERNIVDLMAEIDRATITGDDDEDDDADDDNDEFDLSESASSLPQPRQQQTLDLIHPTEFPATPAKEQQQQQQQQQDNSSNSGQSLVASDDAAAAAAATMTSTAKENVEQHVVLAAASSSNAIVSVAEQEQEPEQHEPKQQQTEDEAAAAAAVPVAKKKKRLIAARMRRRRPNPKATAAMALIDASRNNNSTVTPTKTTKKALLQMQPSREQLTPAALAFRETLNKDDSRAPLHGDFKIVARSDHPFYSKLTEDARAVAEQLTLSPHLNKQSRELCAEQHVREGPVEDFLIAWGEQRNFNRQLRSLREFGETFTGQPEVSPMAQRLHAQQVANARQFGDGLQPRHEHLHSLHEMIQHKRRMTEQIHAAKQVDSVQAHCPPRSPAAVQTAVAMYQRSMMLRSRFPRQLDALGAHSVPEFKPTLNKQ
jgi:hypothetical protein